MHCTTTGPSLCILYTLRHCTSRLCVPAAPAAPAAAANGAQYLFQTPSRFLATQLHIWIADRGSDPKPLFTLVCGNGVVQFVLHRMDHRLHLRKLCDSLVHGVNCDLHPRIADQVVGRQARLAQKLGGVRGRRLNGPNEQRPVAATQQLHAFKRNTLTALGYYRGRELAGVLLLLRIRKFRRPLRNLQLQGHVDVNQTLLRCHNALKRFLPTRNPEILSIAWNLISYNWMQSQTQVRSYAILSPKRRLSTLHHHSHCISSTLLTKAAAAACVTSTAMLAGSEHLQRAGCLALSCTATH